ncbi:MAG: YkgJ family cysteine cluster protein [Nitrospiraceae bacterium]|nr:MAG: YkgJ family cysteine cluster protein [Nitrospiraceae bacterium]
MKKKRSKTNRSKRFSFPEDEKRLPWLSMILDAYHIVDRGISASIESEKKKGRKLACAKGCSSCCATHKDIPLYPLELQGLIWFVTEKFSGPDRELLKNRLESFKRDRACPFLIKNACSVHPVRPMACRQFNVFDIPCKENEDPFHTRRHDVMDPVKRYVDQAFFIMLPYHGIDKESDRIKYIEAGEMHNMVRELHGCNWRALAEKMNRKQ